MCIIGENGINTGQRSSIKNICILEHAVWLHFRPTAFVPAGLPGKVARPGVSPGGVQLGEECLLFAPGQACELIAATYAAGKIGAVACPW